MSEERTACPVPFCRRSIKGRWRWWICAEHWRAVPMRTKARFFQIKRRLKARGEIEVGPRTWWSTTPRAHRLIGHCGERLVEAARKAASGL